MKYIQYLSGISKIVLHYFLTKLVGFFLKNATYYKILILGLKLILIPIILFNFHVYIIALY